MVVSGLPLVLSRETMIGEWALLLGVVRYEIQILAVIAAAWAMIAGWMRMVGQGTLVPR